MLASSSSVVVIDILQIMLRQEAEYSAAVACSRRHDAPNDRRLSSSYDSKCCGNGNGTIDNEVRTMMVDWCCRVITYCNLQLETVVIAMNYADRMMTMTCPIRNDNDDDPSFTTTTTNNIYQYQCIVMTCLYIAAKIHSPEALDPQLVSNLSRHMYSPERIEAQERIILATLQYKVNPITSHAYIHQFFELLSTTAAVSSTTTFILLANETATAIQFALQQIDTYAVTHHCPTSIRPSIIAYCAFMNAIGHVSVLRERGNRSSTIKNHDNSSNNSVFELQFVWNFGFHLAQLLNIDALADEMILQKTQSILGGGGNGRNLGPSLSYIKGTIRTEELYLTKSNNTTRTHNATLYTTNNNIQAK